MAFLTTKNVKISGISACVPKKTVRNDQLSISSKEELKKLIDVTGISERRVAGKNVCTSDLCQKAALQILSELRWSVNDIDILIFVSQTPDYILPATSALIQDHLGLPKTCYTLDISLGCSGYVYGLSVATALMQSGGFRKGLLLVGDTISKICSETDKSTQPLFGDAGTATALEYDPTSPEIHFHLMTDGSGNASIIVNDGGFRNRISEDSFIPKEREGGIVRRDMDLALDGMDVFSFGISKAPESVQSLLNETGKSVEDLDYFVFHQANLFMNRKIEKKLKLPEKKVLYSLSAFGNTSSASIPLTLVTNLSNEKHLHSGNTIICGFGVGLSWGSAIVNLNNTIIPSFCEYD